MTEKQVYKKLEKILNMINEEEYPEIYAAILANICKFRGRGDL